MKELSLILFCINAVFLSAQTKDGYMIFQADGEVTIQRGKNVFPGLEGKQFLPGDYLTIKKGWISLLDDQLKRVTLKEPCTLSFENMAELFRKATSSMENKYLKCLVERITPKEVHTTVPGGAIRGKQLLKFPRDSAIVLSEKICFSFKNPSKDRVQVMIKNRQHQVIQSIPSTDSVLCIISTNTSWWNPGRYFWSIHHEKKLDGEDWLMIIPSIQEKEQIKRELKEIKEKLKDIPEPQLDRIMKKITDLRNWIL